MAKNIQLNLVINGVKQNVTNIKELEEVIKSAEESLKGMEIGSELILDQNNSKVYLVKLNKPKVYLKISKNQSRDKN